MTVSVADLVQVIAHEREGRDRGWWDQMAGSYHVESRVRSMWFTGTGQEFATASRGMAARGDHARHRLSVPSVHLRGERAVVTMPMAIELRIELHGVEADLISYARGVYRMERREGRFRICDLSTIYERDTLTPVEPGDAIAIDRTRWATLPASYRMLAYYFGIRGYDVDPDMPGDDRPESAGALIAEAFDWLTS
ncbi:nuclear transport factor 2 family protein [Mycolicibacterium arenosum]|uniref:Nuclear transport factor 2 family protein n=1 Tax=Mycolicibacterium arenosum TaxID=2952157 RepID=A0ABT1M037_9MYCO|nr:nuclear transport factor 2 family protein [Mycolicibacterium sp. CAU 1645]MCP9272509.1 nuclear transport factor 2 family protein [Mycolicibacterium sp. CAU 1645]